MSQVKYVLKKGQMFGNWMVIDPTREYLVNPNGEKVAVILCYDERSNMLKYVRIHALVYGSSKGSREAYNLHRSQFGSHSTRYKHKRLPKGVYYFKNANKSAIGKKPYRVCKKVNNETVTYGYFKYLDEATAFLQMINGK